MTPTIVSGVIVAVLLLTVWLLVRRRRGVRSDRLDELRARLDPRASRAELSAAVSRLPETEKLVASLTYFEGMEDGEIGRVLGADADAVRRLRESALRRLEATYKQLPGESTPPGD